MKRPITTGHIHQRLKDWGAAVRQNGEATPEGWGWPSVSIAEKMRRERDGAGQSTAPGLNAQEALVFNMRRAEANAIEMATLIRELKWIPRMCVAFKYVHEMEIEAIAEQIGAKPKQVRTTLEEARESLLRAFFTKHELHRGKTIQKTSTC